MWGHWVCETPVALLCARPALTGGLFAYGVMESPCLISLPSILLGEATKPSIAASYSISIVGLKL